MAKISDDKAVTPVDATLFKPLKVQITMRIDADVVVWFKGQGKGYLSRMNAVLREEMMKSGAKEQPDE